MTTRKAATDVAEAPRNTSTARKAATPAKTAAVRLSAKPGVGGGLAPPRKTPLTQLKEYPGNARIGDVDAIADSLKSTGQYKPVIVQESTHYVIAGNHTLKAAAKLGWKTIDALYLDVDDNTARRINLVDNRSNDKATYDTVALAEQLRKIDNYNGTGYSDTDVQGILAAIEDRNVEAISEVLRPTLGIDFEGAEEEDERMERLQKDWTEGDWKEDANITPEEEMRQKNIAFYQHELDGIADTLWTSTTPWGIPDLRTDMLMDHIPEPIDTWAGHEVTPDDGVKHWIWNFGLASSKNLPWDRALLAGFTYDRKFISLWDDPEFQFARLLTNGLRYAIVPDFSMWGSDPPFLGLQAVYRAQWLGRMMQEIGIKIIPRINFRDPESLKWCLDPLPVNAPVMAMCFQSADPKYHDEPRVAELFRNIIRQLKPQSLLVYAGPPGQRLIQRATLPRSLHVVMVDNYAAKRRGVAYDKREGKMNPAVKRSAKNMVRDVIEDGLEEDEADLEE